MASEVTRRQFLGKAGTATAVGVSTATALVADGAETTQAGPLKIVGICCSPRKGKNTAAALQVCLDAARQVGDNVEVELIELAGLKIPGGPAAGVPLEPGEKDDFPGLVPKLSDANLAGLIVATPVYFGNMSYLCKAFLDRCNELRKNFALADKVAGVVAVAGGRNGGQELTIRSVHTCLLGQGMIIVGDAPPTGHWGGTAWSSAPGGVTADEYGMNTVKNLGRHVAEVALRLR
ncbi:MAG: flavodoxin family protein [Candidatus Nealsonbacteria bacterium]|nr:flavodoxin family protein [Candidatus Nealsonbacteria bacterium]